MIHPITWISTNDHLLMERMGRWRLPRPIRVWMIGATRCGDGWLWHAVAIYLLLAHEYRPLLAATLAMACGVALFTVVKRVCRRPRPRFASIAAPDMFSFPSGHTITAFAIAVCLFHYYPAFAPLLLAVATCIAASRVLLGMHYPSDVLAGAAIGTGLGYSAFRLIGA